MKKILILGSDFGTYDIAIEAKKMGLYVITADYLDYTPTKEVSDESWLVSTTDVDEIVKNIKEKNVDAIITGASEFNLDLARIICNRTGLPIYCDIEKAWNVSRNKGDFKKICKENNVLVPTDYEITDDLNEADLENVKYPVVVKPVDKSANRGMSYCNNKNELIEGYKKARLISDNKKIIVERQLVGPRYTAYYVLAEGKASLSYWTSVHNQSNQKANIYSIQDINNCNLNLYLKQMDENIKNVFKEIGCKDGIVWVECMLDQDGEFYAIEMGYRFSGVALYIMHNKLSGFNTIKWMIECSLGIKHKKEELPTTIPAYKEYAISYNLFAKQEDVIEEIVGLKKLEELDNVFIDLPKRKGRKVLDHLNMGLIRIYGENCKEVCETIKYINANFAIKNKFGENLYIKFTEFEKLEEEYQRGLKEFNLV